MDGDWEAPLIPNPLCESAPGCGPWKSPNINNPNYKGKWHAPLIENPNYKGKWKPRRIPNPDFFEDKNPFRMTDIVSIESHQFDTNYLLSRQCTYRQTVSCVGELVKSLTCALALYVLSLSLLFWGRGGGFGCFNVGICVLRARQEEEEEEETMI
jgi:hypothetical protein